MMSVTVKCHTDNGFTVEDAHKWLSLSKIYRAEHLLKMAYASLAVLRHLSWKSSG